ncbi:hypothetical protein DFH08DRAFT_904443 [Mycena albidolilacea]|uniref:Uncharacterized protein n=1 Tax=Mycena albidolilacea TaxID=1033008 RepID=A0AAD7E8L3_9AGAR|nr:hypothetical protein DFH08DRAFT_904443 [Mycena albidolilacea]
MSPIEAQIHRARSLKIHFHGSKEADSRAQIQMSQLLAQHFSRWEELCLGLTSNILPLLITIHGRLASLERLWIQWNDSERPDSLDCFWAAPSLVDFGAIHEDHFVPIWLPIHQLTRLELNAPWETHKGILKLAHSLIQVHIEIEFDDDELWLDTDELVNLSHLRRRLYVTHPGAFQGFP